MKKLLLLHTGGTFGMSPVQPHKTLQPGNIQIDIETYLPALKRIADLDIQIPFNKDSSEIGPAEWKVLIRTIEQCAEDYEGIVIIHGTDTIVYTAAALSFLLDTGDKPVILTGSQRPLSSVRSDARSNLINSIELATYDIPEVGICFGNALYRGNRTKKVSIESYQGFESPNYQPLAKIGLNIHLFRQYFWRGSRNNQFKPRFDRQFAVIPVYPGLNPVSYQPILDAGIKSLILETYGAGNLPVNDPNWIPFIRNAKKTGKSIFIVSQSAHGAVDLDLYECGRRAREAGAIALHDMTREAAIIKLMILQANESDQNNIEQRMLQCLAGEISISG